MDPSPESKLLSVRQLDQLDQVLDALDSKSSNIQDQMQKLLEDSRQVGGQAQEDN